MHGVSVLMPCYNTEVSQLREAVASVHGQGFAKAPFEILCIDDCSPRSDVREVIQALADTPGLNVRAHFLSQNGGQGAALNHGLKHAQYDYILPLDSDDVLLSPLSTKSGRGYMEQGMDILQSRPDIHLFTARFRMFGAAEGDQISVPYTPKRLLHRNMIPNYAMYRRADVMAAGGYEPSIRVPSDWAMWLRLQDHLRKDGKPMGVLQSSEVMYGYRQHSDGHNLATYNKFNRRKNIERMVRHVPDLYREAYPHIPLDMIPASLEARLYASWARTMAKHVVSSPKIVAGLIKRKVLDKVPFSGPDAGGISAGNP